eukprot:scaffold263641_cov24-Tisochrysis_lutea.AAC.1
MEVEMEECLELAAEQEREWLESQQAEHNQRKREQRLRELSRMRVDSLSHISSHSASRPASVSVPSLQDSLGSDSAVASPRQGLETVVGPVSSRLGVSRVGSRPLSAVPEMEVDAPKDVPEVEAGVPKDVPEVDAPKHAPEVDEPTGVPEVGADIHKGVPEGGADTPKGVPGGGADTPKGVPNGCVPKAVHESDGGPQGVPSEAAVPKVAHGTNGALQGEPPGDALLQAAPSAKVPQALPSEAAVSKVAHDTKGGAQDAPSETLSVQWATPSSSSLHLSERLGPASSESSRTAGANTRGVPNAVHRAELQRAERQLAFGQEQEHN